MVYIFIGFLIYWVTSVSSRSIGNYLIADMKLEKKKKTSSVYDCTVEDVEYICNSNSTLCLFYFAIFVVMLLS